MLTSVFLWHEDAKELAKGISAQIDTNWRYIDKRDPGSIAHTSTCVHHPWQPWRIHNKAPRISWPGDCLEPVQLVLSDDKNSMSDRTYYCDATNITGFRAVLLGGSCKCCWIHRSKALAENKWHPPKISKERRTYDVGACRVPSHGYQMSVWKHTPFKVMAPTCDLCVCVDVSIGIGVWRLCVCGPVAPRSLQWLALSALYAPCPCHNNVCSWSAASFSTWSELTNRDDSSGMKRSTQKKRLALSCL